MIERSRLYERLARCTTGVFIALAGASAALASPLHAQVSDLVTGDVIRIGSGQFTLESVSRDFLALRETEGPGVVRVPIALLPSVDVQRPRSRFSGAGRGALLGLLIGGGGGAVIGGAGGTVAGIALGESGGGLIQERLVIVSVGGLVGLGVGLIWGLAFPGQGWEEIPLDRPMTIDSGAGVIAFKYRLPF